MAVLEYVDQALRLVIVSADADQLLFLLLLRLSPPPQRLYPFSLHLPPSVASSPTTSYRNNTDSNSIIDPTSPTQYHHHRNQSHHTVLSGPSNYSNRAHNTLNLNENEYIEAEGEEHESDSEPDHSDPDYNSDTNSSISESSIIDLPLPLSPSRIIPPKSLSMNGGINLAALEDARVIGPLVRRTRSARLLGRSLSGRSKGRGSVGGYGTFGGET